jgi:mercuric ion transport protein
MAAGKESTGIKPERGWSAGAGLTAGLAGIVASSCCVLPLVLAGLGLGSATFAVLPVLAAARPYLLGAAVLALGIAWFAHLRPLRAGDAGAKCSSDGATGTVCATDVAPRRAHSWLGIVTAIVGLALVWQSLVEPKLLLLFR